MERFAVVKWLANGSSVWVCACDDLAEAKTKMLDLTRRTGLEHFVYDFLVGSAIARVFDHKKTAGSAGGVRPAGRACAPVDAAEHESPG